MTANFCESTLAYSWGSAAFGKLGLGVSTEKDCDAAPEFIKEDLGRVKLNFDDPEVYQYYTYSPQPIVAFLGTKVKSITAGLHHFMALTTLGELYSWGDNSQCQLGHDDPDALFMPNPYNKEPALISTLGKPDGKDGSSKHEKNSQQTARSMSIIQQSQNSDSVADGAEEVQHEVVWEQD